MTIENLITAYQKWAKDINCEDRVQNKEDGYHFIANAIKYAEELTLQGFQKFFDRKDLNDEYKKRYNAKQGKDRLPYAWYQTEINLIYSFHKCFAMRHNTRLQYYRNDLSQKGARNYSALHIAVGKLQYRQDSAEQK